MSSSVAQPDVDVAIRLIVGGLNFAGDFGVGPDGTLRWVGQARDGDFVDVTLGTRQRAQQ